MMAGGNEAQRSDRMELNCQKIRMMKVNVLFFGISGHCAALRSRLPCY
jgi:hypothetical protein